MTWKTIIDNNIESAYRCKAEKQDFVYLLCSMRPPYLPIDYTYSLYEIAKKYDIPYNTVLADYSQSKANKKYKFTIEKVYIN